jgi:glucosyltransferase
MKYRPIVSVIITCYNYGKFVEESISSVMNQSYNNIKLFVINDGSTDKSDEVIKGLKKIYNFEYIYQDNVGVVATRNRALDIAVGDYAIQLDADDWIDVNYVEEVVKLAEKTNADIVYTDYSKFGSDIEISNFPDFNLEILKNKNYVHVSSLVRLKAIKKNKFDVKLQNLSHEDWDFFLTLALQGNKFIKCTTTHLNYRIHSSTRNNIQSTHDEQYNYAKVYVYTIEKLRKIYPRELNYLASTYFADWFIHTDDNLKETDKELRRAQHEIELKAAHIDNLEKRIGVLSVPKSKKLIKKIKNRIKRSK